MGAARERRQIPAKARLRRLLKRFSIRVFLLFDRIGIHVLPKHYYTPIPDYAWLRANRDAWADPSPLVGIDWDPDAQMAWLREVCEPYRDEVAGLGYFDEFTATDVGLGFGPIESQILHGVIRTYAPSRVIEIGSGVSTRCTIRAVEMNVADRRRDTAITCVEPYPSAALRSMRRIDLVEEVCQKVSPAVFDVLESGDLLFVDSSHSVKVGSDVVRIYLDIIPRLPAGVLVHIHDINLPYLYSRTALNSYFGWQESVLLAALLVNNTHLEVLASASALHYARQRDLVALFSDYRPQPDVNGLLDTSASGDDARHFPSSIWLQTV